MEEQLVETWNIHDRINRYLLEAVPDAALSATIGPKHRTAAQLFAHLHNVLVGGSIFAMWAGITFWFPKVTGRRLSERLAKTHFWLWTIGFMRVFDLSFNLANVWGLPLIIGASAEYGLNVVLRYRDWTVAGGAPFPRSGIFAVGLSGLTTMSGFGSLMVAHHQGIFGLGLLLTIGTAAALASSLVLVPALLSLGHRGLFVSRASQEKEA